MLGDRPVSVTLARCWAALSRWARVRFIFNLLWGGLFMGGADLKAQVEQLKVMPCTQSCTVWMHMGMCLQHAPTCGCMATAVAHGDSRSICDPRGG